MRAGQLRHRVALYKPNGSITFDSHGQTVEGTTLVSTVWGSIEPLRGTEGLLTRQLSDVLTHKVTIRYSTEVSAVDPKWHFLYGSRRLNIGEVLNVDERKKTLEALCAEQL